jgi:Excalibur calcium-binding domain
VKGVGLILVRYAGVLGFVAPVMLFLPPGGAAVDGPTVTARAPLLYRNCTNLNMRYPHGVGRLTARDRTSGTPVTNFRRSTRIYNIAMSHNRGLDRDKDGIACEKA